MENKLREEVSAAVALVATLGVRTSNQLMPHQHQHDQHQYLQQIDMRRMIVGNSQLQPFMTQTPDAKRSMIATKNDAKQNKKKRNFAQKLFDVLDSGYHSDVTKWLPGGKAFIVLNKRRFANEILPLYFKQSQYSSFTRKLRRWKFTRVSRGPYMGTYYHKHFRANNMRLCETMSCNDSKLLKSPGDHENEDDSDDDEEIAALEAVEETNVTIPPARTSPVILSATAPPRPASSERSNSNFGQALMLRNNLHDDIYNTNNNILLIEEQLMEIRLRKARVHKRKQLLLMQAEAERLKKIQMIKNAVTASIQQSESRIIAAAARALDRNNNIHRSLLQNQIRSPSSQWQALPWLTQDAAIRALRDQQDQGNTKQTESNGMNPRAYAA